MAIRHHPLDHPRQWCAGRCIALVSLLFRKMMGRGGEGRGGGAYCRGSLVWYYGPREWVGACKIKGLRACSREYGICVWLRVPVAKHRILECKKKGKALGTRLECKARFCRPQGTCIQMTSLAEHFVMFTSFLATTRSISLYIYSNSLPRPYLTFYAHPPPPDRASRGSAIHVFLVNMVVTGFQIQGKCKFVRVKYTSSHL